MTESCKTCVYFYFVQHIKRECRRYPPTKTEENEWRGSFPSIPEDSWCGEYKKGEEE